MLSSTDPRERRSPAPSRAGYLAIAVAAMMIVQVGLAQAHPRSAPKAGIESADVLTPHLQAGQTFTNVFARIASIDGDGFEEKLRHYSGLGSYVVSKDSTEGGWKFDLSLQNHGSPPDRGSAVIRDQGQAECFKGQCRRSRDCCGLLYNIAIWGVPPRKLEVGTRWTTDLAEVWEFGPPGRQTVTVISVDPVARMVTLTREGEGEGRAEGDPKQIHVDKGGKSYMVDFAPGRAHWIGQTIIKDGVIISDEIMAYRSVVLSSPEFGSVKAMDHEFTVQNTSPQPADGSRIRI